MDKLKVLPIIASIITILNIILSLLDSIEFNGFHFSFPQIRFDSIVAKVLFIMVIEFVIAFSFAFIISFFMKLNGIFIFLTYLFSSILISWIRIYNYKTIFFSKELVTDVNNTLVHESFGTSILLGTTYFSIILCGLFYKENDDDYDGFLNGCGLFIIFYLSQMFIVAITLRLLSINIEL